MMPRIGIFYDREGNCVAHDDEANLMTRDDLAVSWIPAKGGEYTFELVNLGRYDNKVNLAVK